MEPIVGFKLHVLLSFALASLVIGRGDYGSCKCSGMVTFATEKLYRSACEAAFRKCSGYGSNSCDCFENCRLKGRVIRIRRTGRGWTCKARCGGGTFQCPTPPGGIGDPHLTGFDGSQFDFHGVDKGRYLLLRKSGDSSLVAQMRARSWTGTKQGVVKTFFHKFGIVNADGKAKILIALDEDRNSTGDAVPVVKMNGVEVTSHVMIGGVDVIVKDDGKTIIVKTKSIEYQFLARTLNGRNYHFDFTVQVGKEIDSAEDYSGILGDTVEVKSGAIVSSEHSSTAGYLSGEMSRRHMYAVESLFGDGDVAN